MKSLPCPPSLAVPFRSLSFRTLKGASPRSKKPKTHKMRKRTLHRVDVLEKAERSRQLDQHSSLATSFFFCRKVVLAHYLGGLEADDEDPGEAEARALSYESRDDYLEALFKGEKSEINKRFRNAARRLFAQAGLDFDRSPRSALFESFVGMVNELPPQWMNWLSSNLQEECRKAPTGTGSNVPVKFFLSAVGDRPAVCRRRLTR
jgi:hypothetical protein